MFARAYLVMTDPPGRRHNLGIPGLAAADAGIAGLYDAQLGDCRAGGFGNQL